MTRQPLVRLYKDEAIVDNFAGGGEAARGEERGQRRERRRA